MQNKTTEKDAAELQERIVAHLKEKSAAGCGRVGLRDLHVAMGHPKYDAYKPLKNPVNVALIALRDSGRITQTGGRWSEPSFSIPSN